MATGTIIRIKALLANLEIATVGLRFPWVAAAPAVADLNILATDCALEMANHRDLYCADITGFTVSAQNFEHAIGPAPGNVPYWKPTSIEFGNQVPIGAGTHAGSSTTPQCAVAVTLRTALAGRSFLGRLFCFPPPESEVDSGGTIAGTHFPKDMIDGVATAALGAPTVNGVGPLSVFSAKLDSSEEVIVTAQGIRIDTQRRRLSRTG